jgi:hypothetical protein
MSILVRLPNGERVSVPTDDPKEAAAAASKHWGTRSPEDQQMAPAPKPATPAKRSLLQTAGDFVGDTIDNFVPNFGDEIAAIPDAAKALVKGEDVGAAYSQGRKDFKSHQAQYDKEHPWLSWGSTLGGLGASLALPAGRVAEGAGLGIRALHGAAVGAGYGAVSGAGEGDTLSERGGNALNGAVIGGAFGAGASPVISGLSRVGRIARQTLPGVDAVARALPNIPRAVMRRPLNTRINDANRRADRVMSSRMNDGHISTGFGQQGAPATPDNLVAELERRQAIGVPAVMGDLSEPMRGVTSWASRGMGPGQTRVREALDARKAQEAIRVRQHITEELGPTVDPLFQGEQHLQRARTDAAPAYREAYSQPMVITPEIESIMRTPAFREAVPRARRNIENAQRDPDALGFRLNPQGRLERADTLSTEGFDQVIRAMRDSGRAAMDKTGFRPRDTTDSVHINARARDLRDHLASQNPAYRDSIGMYADEMAHRDALQLGQDVTKMSGHEIREAGRATLPDARGSWAIGARSALADKASEFGARHPTGNTAAHIRGALGDQTKQTAIGEMMGNPAALDGLQQRLEAESQGNVLWSEVQGNSKTAQRQQNDADLNAAAGQASQGSLLSTRGMLNSVLNHISSGAVAGTGAAVKERIARIATEGNPQTVRELLDQVARTAQEDRDFANLLHRSGLISAKGYSANIKPQNTESAPVDDDGWTYNDDDTLGVKLGG